MKNWLMKNSKPMVDSNILVYAHNQDSPFYDQARNLFIELIDKGGFSVTNLILHEFFAVITNGRKVEAPLLPEEALAVIMDMLETPFIEVLPNNNGGIFFDWLKKYINTTKRYQIYDASIAFEMNQHGIMELYTKNIKDFKKFDFINVINPFEFSSPRSPLPAHAKEGSLSSAPGSTLQAPRFIPYGRQSIDEKDIAAVCNVLRSDWLTTGPKVEEFEQAVADFVGAKYAVAVSSGTAALHAAMFALGIGPGDEVIVPPMTFAATANCIIYQGGIPVFADVDPDTLLIDPVQVEAKITPKTKAIIGVDYAGQPCDWDALQTIAKKYNLALVDDGCHALGAEYKGKKVGTLADITVFSFHPVKHITTGEGGMIVTDDSFLAHRMKLFRNHGITRDPSEFVRSSNKSQDSQLLAPSSLPYYYEMQHLGYNYRITDFQCALGLSQLGKLPNWIVRRQEIAAIYDEALNDIPGIKPLGIRADVLPASQSAMRQATGGTANALRSAPCALRSTHVYHLYVIRIDETQTGVKRTQMFTALRNAGIGVNVHYIPVHLHPYYQSQMNVGPGLCPVAESTYEALISLPMYTGLSDADVESVIAVAKQTLS